MPDMISSRTNPKILALLQIKEKPSKDAFLIEGFHLVEMAYQRGFLKEVYGTIDPKINGVPFTQISPSVLDKITVSKTPEGVVGVAYLPKEESHLGEKAVLLDRVQDPGNVGTICRSALAFGYHDVIFLPGCANPLGAKAMASSQGAFFGLNLHFLEANEVVDFASSHHSELLATALEGATPLQEAIVPARHILCLGNEGKGLSRELLESSSLRLKIEMDGIDSLNVAIAGGILMYVLSKEAKA